MHLRVDSAKLRRSLRRREIEAVFRAMPQDTFGEALELGAGDGFQAPLLARYAKKVLCTDLNDERLQRVNDPRVAYDICDAEALPYEAGRFDLVYSSNLLEHLPNPDEPGPARRRSHDSHRAQSLLEDTASCPLLSAPSPLSGRDRIVPAEAGLDGHGREQGKQPEGQTAFIRGAKSASGRPRRVRRPLLRVHRNGSIVLEAAVCLCRTRDGRPDSRSSGTLARGAWPLVMHRLRPGEEWTIAF